MTLTTAHLAPVDLRPDLDTASFIHERARHVENGTRGPLTFSDAEMTRRLTALREVMAAERMDAAVFTSMHGIKYFSDFLYTSFGRHYALLVTANDAVVVSAGIDAAMPWRRSSTANVVYTDWGRRNFELTVAAEFIRSLAPAAGAHVRVGVEDDQMPLALRRRLEAAIGESVGTVELVDVAVPAMRLRMIKSNEEIAVITDGARTADLGGEAIADLLREAGRSGARPAEWEVAEAGTRAMTAEIAARYPHTEIRDSWVWFQAGLNTDGAHNWPTTRRVAEGDLLSLNCFPMISGYYTALERTMVFGEPSAEQLRYWEINLEVYRRGLELVRPGAVCREIAEELNTIYAEAGVLGWRTFGYGHSFGVLSHYYGREAGLELREDIDTVLTENMVVSIEPMITVPEGLPGAGGYREHDILVVTADGARNITGFGVGPETNVIGVDESRS